MKNLNLCEIQKKIKEFDSKIGQTPERETVKLTREQNQSIADDNTNEGNNMYQVFDVCTLDGDLLEGEETFNKLMNENATYILPNPANSQENILLKPIGVNPGIQLIFIKGESVMSESHPSNDNLYDLYRGVVIFNQDTNSIKAQLMKDTIQINIYQESEQS